MIPDAFILSKPQHSISGLHLASRDAPGSLLRKICDSCDSSREPQTRRRRRVTHPVCRCALFLATPGPSRRPRRPHGSACSRQLAKSKNDSRQPATSRTRDNFATTPTRDSPRHLAGEARRCCSAVCTLSSERSRFLSIGVPTCISVPETLPARSS